MTAPPFNYRRVVEALRQRPEGMTAAQIVAYDPHHLARGWVSYAARRWGRGEVEVIRRPPPQPTLYRLKNTRRSEHGV